MDEKCFPSSKKTPSHFVLGDVIMCSIVRYHRGNLMLANFFADTLVLATVIVVPRFDGEDTKVVTLEHGTVSIKGYNTQAECSGLYDHVFSVL